MSAPRYEAKGASMVKDPGGEFFHARDVLAALEQHVRTNVSPRKRDRELYKRFDFLRLRTDRSGGWARL